jgi:hypothetical protein
MKEYTKSSVESDQEKMAMHDLPLSHSSINTQKLSLLQILNLHVHQLQRTFSPYNYKEKLHDIDDSFHFLLLN